MSVLSDALAAMDKATPGPWKYCGCGSCQLVWGDGFLIHDQPDGGCEAPIPYNSTGINNAIIIGAAPDALAWIKEALPLMEKLIEPIDEYLGTVAGGDVNYFHEQLNLYEKTKALIARAKPEV